MLSFKITTVIICALLPALSSAAYIQPEARFGPPSGTPACMRKSLPSFFLPFFGFESEN